MAPSATAVPRDSHSPAGAPVRRTLISCSRVPDRDSQGANGRRFS